MVKSFAFVFLALSAVCLGGCSKAGSTTRNGGPPRLFVGRPPHGGTAIDLGDDFHVEFVRDAADGKLQAFVLDGEMEEFVRSPSKGFEVVAQFGGRREKLDFAAVANRATGETAGDSSMFEAQAGWLKTATQFDGVLDEISAGGTIYTNIPFSFPKGNDEGARK